MWNIHKLKELKNCYQQINFVQNISKVEPLFGIFNIAL